MLHLSGSTSYASCICYIIALKQAQVGKMWAFIEEETKYFHIIKVGKSKDLSWVRGVYKMRILWEVVKK